MSRGWTSQNVTWMDISQCRRDIRLTGIDIYTQDLLKLPSISYLRLRLALSAGLNSKYSHVDSIFCCTDSELVTTTARVNILGVRVRAGPAFGVGWETAASEVTSSGYPD
ncbi:hypothetical protein RRG08_018173 [Elysia crispata]|uniref:Uncharacterized protein n=1 Tax=Elysia crispata TaxID=231223 RepID=A0AAE1AES6_9GAST|nr:hypothetical protein RRG08_018173 [Elysia crispata]